MSLILLDDTFNLLFSIVWHEESKSQVGHPPLICAGLGEPIQFEIGNFVNIVSSLQSLKLNMELTPALPDIKCLIHFDVRT